MIRRYNWIVVAIAVLASALHASGAFSPVFSDSFTGLTTPVGWTKTDIQNQQCSYARTYNSYPSTWTVSQATTILPGDTFSVGQLAIMGKGYDHTTRGSILTYGSPAQQRAGFLFSNISATGRPLGMSENVIADVACTASSTFTTAAFPLSIVYAAGARLDNRDTWWAPATADPTPYLQIDLGIDYEVSSFGLQGSPAQPQWVTALDVQYQTNAVAGSATWTAVGSFAGTTGSNITSFHAFAAPIRGRVFRLYPTSFVGAAAMRVEFFGRHWLAPGLGMNPSAVLTIADAAINSSSVYTPDNGATFPYPAVAARFGDAYVGWAAAGTGTNEYLQVDLGATFNLRGMAVNTHKGVSWWVITYYVQTSLDGWAWSTVSDAGGVPVTFNGPTVRDVPMFAQIPGDGVFARYVRINPQTYRGPLISLRVELYGTAVSGAASAPGPFAWSDYSVALQMLSWDRGASGVAFRVADPYNYYELKIMKGQKANAHQTSTLTISVTGVTLNVASSCTTVPFSCLTDDNAATQVVTNADGQPTITVDLRQYLTISNVTVNIKTNAWNNAKIAVSTTGTTYVNCGSGVVASVPVGLWFQNCYNQNVRFIQISVASVQSITVTDIQVFGPAVASSRSLLKRRGGAYTVLQSSNLDINLDTWYPTTVTAIGNVLSFTHNGDSVQVTDNAPDAILTGSVAVTSGQNFAAYYDQVVVSASYTAIGTANGVVQSAGTWQYFAVTAPGVASDVLYCSIARTSSTPAAGGGTFALYSKASSPPSEVDTAAGVSPVLVLSDSKLGVVTAVVPNPTPNAVYYFGVYADSRDGTGLTYNAVGATPTVTTITPQFGVTTAGSLAAQTSVAFYKYTPTTPYTWTTISFSVLTSATDVCILRVKAGSVPTSLSADAVTAVGINAAGGRTTYSYVLTPVAAGTTYFFSFAINTATAGAPASVSYILSVNPADPLLSVLNPSTSPTTGGTQLIITGANFDASGTVTINSIYTCSPQQEYTPTSIKCTIPAGAGGPTNVTVTTVKGFFGFNPTFAYNAPTLTSALIPAKAQPAVLTGPTLNPGILEMTGTQFGPTPVVTVGGRPCVPLAVTPHTFVRCTIPNGEGLAQPVFVSAGNQHTPTVYFDYFLPVLSYVSLTTYATVGGVDITLAGSNFGTSYLVLVGPFVCPLKPGRFNHTYAVCTLPPGAGANLPVKLVSGGQNATAPQLFTYFPPTLTSVGPPPLSGPTGAMRTLTLTGSNFGPAPIILFGVGLCVPVFNNHSYCTCVLQSGEGVNQPITLNAGGVLAIIGASQYTFDRPSLSGIAPALLPTQPSPITVSGNNFGATGPKIMIGSLQCVIVSFNATVATCMSPASQGTGLTVTIEVGGQTGTNTLTVSYAPPRLDSITPQLGSTDGTAVVVVTGANFGVSQQTGDLTVGGRPCVAGVGGWSHTSITCTLPAGQGLNVAVSITVAGQSSTATPLTYSYGAPVITSVVPSSVNTEGQLITINGQNFGLSGSVMAGGRACTYAVAGYTSSQIQCTLAAAVADVLVDTISVDVASQISNSFNFSYNAPVVQSTNPTSANTNGGSLLTIFGNSFGVSGSVTIGGQSCAVGGAGTSYSGTKIVCSVPTGQGASLPLVVTSGSGLASIGSAFLWSYNAPQVTGVSATSKPTRGGTVLTVQGNSFGASGGSVTIAGLPCTVQTYDHSSITCLLPAGEGLAQNLLVTSGTLTGNPFGFNYDAPIINSLTPSHGSPAGNYPITVTGTNFGTNAQVTIGGVNAVVVSGPTNADPSQIVVTVPALVGGGSGAQSAQVHVGGQASNSPSFTYDVTPIIVFASPLSGPSIGGTTVTLIGSNLNEPGSAIRVGGAVCTPIGVSTNARVVCSTPGGQGSASPLVADNNGQTSNSFAFAYDAPIINTVAPSRAGTDGTDRIAIYGLNFGVTPVVFIASGVCTLLQANHTFIFCIPPVKYGAGQNVTVNAGGQSSNPFEFNFDAPSIDRVTGCLVNDAPYTSGCPNFGTATTITVDGHNFGTASEPISVKVGDYVCANLVRLVDQTRFRCEIPAGVGALLEVAITVGGQTGSRGLVSYDGPSINRGSLQVNGGAFGGTHQLASTGDELSFSTTPSFPSGDSISVVIVPGQYPCAIKSVSNGIIKCTTSAGYGANLGVQLIQNIGSNMLARSLPSNFPYPVATPPPDAVSYPPPVLKGGTIRALAAITPSVQTLSSIKALAEVGALGSTVFVGSTVSGETVTFDISNAGSNAALITVTYKTAGWPAQQCTGVTIPIPGSISCRTGTQQFGSPAGPYHFTVLVNGALIGPGTDAYFYPEQQTVLSASGCPVVEGVTTSHCPSEGAGLQLTIGGTGFSASLGSTTIRVGLNLCPNVVPITDQLIACDVPFGIGSDLPVTVTTGAYTATSAVGLVSYSGPVVYNVTGCTPDPFVAGRTIDCPRGGDNITLTISGVNFGLSHALVFVANSECKNVQHSATHPNRLLTCTLPAGAGANQPVTILQNGGTAGSGYLSYELCPAGTYTVAGATGSESCVPCVAGSYINLPGQPTCKTCPVGTVAPFPGTAVCSTCGFLSIPDFNRVSCLCAVGYYFPDGPASNVTGNTGDLQCVLCPLGADCRAAGVRATTMVGLNGWWRANQFSLEFNRCLRSPDCPGGLAYEPDAQCGENKAGNLCANCKSGYRLTTGDRCVPCPAYDAGSAYLVLLIVGLIAIVAVQLWIILRSDPVLLQRAIDQVPETGAGKDGAAGKSLASAVELPSVVPGTGAPAVARPTHVRDRTESDIDSVHGYGAFVPGDKPRVPQFPGYPVPVQKHADAYFPASDDLYDSGAESLQLTVHGPPPPVEDFAYKLKIFVTFLQIATKVATGLQIDWPTYYKEWILWFNVINFDFLVLNVSSVECVTDVDYYKEYVIVMLVPPFLFILCAIVYLLPNAFDKCCYASHTREMRQRNMFRFYKIFLYLLFLIYIGVSSMVLRHYVCFPIEDKSYLLADLSVECFDDRWRRYAIGSLVLLLVYVVGIPAYFAYLLYSNRSALYKHSQPAVKQQLGILYAGYRMPLWWFELVDMAHKLFLTSILAFFPRAAQMPLGMAWTALYLIVILRVNPYIRRDDDRLHVLAQVELFMLFLAGNVFTWFNADTYGYDDQVLMSVFLVGLTLLFFAVFLEGALRFVWAIISESCCQRAQPLPKTPKDKAEAGGDPQVVVHRPGPNGVARPDDGKDATVPVPFGSAVGATDPDVEEDTVKEQIRQEAAAAAAGGANGASNGGVALPKRFLLPPLSVKPAARPSSPPAAIAPTGQLPSSPIPPISAFTAPAPAPVVSGQTAIMIGGGGGSNAAVPVPPTPNSVNETTITSPVGRMPVVPPTPMQ